MSSLGRLALAAALLAMISIEFFLVGNFRSAPVFVVAAPFAAITIALLLLRFGMRASYRQLVDRVLVGKPDLGRSLRNLDISLGVIFFGFFVCLGLGHILLEQFGPNYWVLVVTGSLCGSLLLIAFAVIWQRYRIQQALKLAIRSLEREARG